MTTPSNGHYSKLYDEIAERRDLSPGARILFSVILALGRTSGECFASNKTLSQRAGLGLSQIKQSLVKLEEKGLIAREAKRKLRQTIKVLWVPPEQPKCLVEVAGIRPDERPESGHLEAGNRPVKRPESGHSSGRNSAHGGRNSATSYNAVDRANRQSNRGILEPEGSKNSILEQTSGGSTDPLEGSATAAGTANGTEPGSPFDWAAFREAFSLSRKTNPGVIAFGKLKPEFPPEEAPIQDDPIIQAALAERMERDRRRAELNSHAT